MNEIKLKNKIKDAIKFLRSSKNRSDFTKIHEYLTKRYSIDTRTLKSDLLKCVEGGILFEHEHKGTTSYRISAEEPDDSEQIITNKRLLTDIVKLLGTKGNLEDGMSLEMLVDHFGQQSGNNKPSVIKKLVKLGITMNMIENKADGNIIAVPKTIKVPPCPIHTTKGARRSTKLSTSMLQNGIKPSMKRNESDTHNVVILGRRKRKEKVMFDPSDHNIPKRKMTKIIKTEPKSTNEKKTVHAIKKVGRTNKKDSTVSLNDSDTKYDISIVGGVCCVCRIQINNSSEKLVECKDCNNKAHMKCLNDDDGMLRMRPDSTWQCPHCKTCVICDETTNAGLLTVCSICSDAYHTPCHSPRIQDIDKSSPDWVCNNCSKASFKSSPTGRPKYSNDSITSESDDDSEYSNSMPKLKRLSINKSSDDVLSDTFENSNARENISQFRTSTEKVFSQEFGYYIDPTVPDASSWTVDEVYEYFFQFFPEDAVILKDELIDGSSLLLMTRDNILYDLHLKLGVALKLYRHVTILQERRDNPSRYYL